MKKILLILSVCFLASCSTSLKIETTVGNPEITWDGKTLCAHQKFKAVVDTTMMHNGIRFGNDTNYIFIRYKDGALEAEGNACYKLIK